MANKKKSPGKTEKTSHPPQRKASPDTKPVKIPQPAPDVRAVFDSFIRLVQLQIRQGVFAKIDQAVIDQQMSKLNEIKRELENIVERATKRKHPH